MDLYQPIEPLSPRERFYLSNWLAGHPWITAVLVCAVCLLPMFLETPR